MKTNCNCIKNKIHVHYFQLMVIVKWVELQTCKMGRVEEKNQALLMERNVGESGIKDEVVLRLM